MPAPDCTRRSTSDERNRFNPDERPHRVNPDERYDRSTTTPDQTATTTTPDQTATTTQTGSPAPTPPQELDPDIAAHNPAIVSADGNADLSGVQAGADILGHDTADVSVGLGAVDSRPWPGRYRTGQGPDHLEPTAMTTACPACRSVRDVPGP